MKTPAVLLAVPLALAAATIAISASAQTLEISHADGKAAIVLPNGNRVAFDHQDEIRIDPNRVTAIRITNTNSALYTCQVDQEVVEVPEIAALREFLAQAGPLVPGVIGLGLDRRGRDLLRREIEKADDLPSAEEVALRAGVLRVDEAIYGPRGFMQTHLATIETLNKMRDPDAPVRWLAGELRQELPCADGDCNRLTFVGEIAGALEGIFNARRKFVDARGKNPELLARADSIITNANKLLASAHETEALAVRVAHAKPVIDCDPVQVSRSKGRQLTVAVATRSAPELARVAPRGPRTLKATAMPRLQPRPAVGLSLLYAPGAEYDKYTTVDEEGGGARIGTSGTEDDRIGYGLVLGLGWGDQVGPTQSPVRVWIPELTINPTDELKTIGLGGGLSFGPVKIGGGWVWNRHTVLDRQRVGDVLDDAAQLRTRETYGGAKPYISLSFVGWPPFLNP